LTTHASRPEIDQRTFALDSNRVISLQEQVSLATGSEAMGKPYFARQQPELFRRIDTMIRIPIRPVNPVNPVKNSFSNKARFMAA